MAVRLLRPEPASAEHSDAERLGSHDSYAEYSGAHNPDAQHPYSLADDSDAGYPYPAADNPDAQHPYSLADDSDAGYPYPMAERAHAEHPYRLAYRSYAEHIDSPSPGLGKMEKNRGGLGRTLG